MSHFPHALTLLLSVTLLFSACQPEEAETGQEDLVRTVTVNIDTVETEVFNNHLRLVGTVTTSNDVQISAEVGGRVTTLYNREGAAVSQGENILKIDDQQIRQDIRRLQAMTDQSRENYERLRNLYDSDNIGSEIDVINARSQFEQNLATLESRQVDLENTTISAPFDGTIEDISVETGETVTAGSPVLRMVSQSGLKLNVGVPARYANVIGSGDEAEVWFDFDPETIITLPVAFVGNSINPENRTFRVELIFPNEMENVKLDMLANVRLRTEHIEDVIVVSEEYVFRKGDGYVVYVAGENENGVPVAVERSLVTGPAAGSRIVVHEGLEEGDSLITNGASYLQDGTRITIVEELNN